MKTSEAIDTALLLAGEDPKLSLWDEDDGNEGCSIRQRMLLDIEACAAEAILDTPPMQLTGWKQLDGNALTIEDDGRAILPLPDDFLTLFSIKMTGWQKSVTELMPHDHWLRGMQSAYWPGLRGTPERPLAFMGVGTDGKPCIELFSCPAPDSLEEGWYMPAPKIDADGNIDIPPAAYRKCLLLLARNIPTTLS